MCARAAKWVDKKQNNSTQKKNSKTGTRITGRTGEKGKWNGVETKIKKERGKIIITSILEEVFYSILKTKWLEELNNLSKNSRNWTISTKGIDYV